EAVPCMFGGARRTLCASFRSRLVFRTLLHVYVVAGCTIESEMQIVVNRLAALALCAGALALAGSDDHAASAVEVSVGPPGTVVIRTPEAEFDLLTSGYLEGHLVRGQKRLTLD